MTNKVNGKTRFVRCPRCRNVLPEPSDVPVYKCGGCDATLQAKKRNDSTVNAIPRKLDDDSSGKRKVDQVFGDQEAGSCSNQQLLLTSTGQLDQESVTNVVLRLNNDQDAANKALPSHGKQKMKQLCEDHEASSSSNQETVVNSMDEHEPDRNNHNDPRSSTELSGHEDPGSSPEAAGHSIVDQEQEKEQNEQLLLNSIDETDHYSDHDDLHRSNKDQDASNKAKTGIIDVPSPGVKEHSSGKQKMKQLSDDYEASSSSNQQNIHNDPRSSTELSGHDEPDSSPEATGHNRTYQEQDQQHEQNQKLVQHHYQDAGEKQQNTTFDATSDGFEHSSGKQKINQLSDNDDETCCSLNQQFMVTSVKDLDQNNNHNEPHNSSELSYHEDQDSSPEATVHNKIDQRDDHDQVFLSCRRELEFEETSSEFEEAFPNTIASKSSFKTLIAEKLLDTKQKRPMYLDEDDTISETETADLHHHLHNQHHQLHHRRRNDNITTARFSGMNYYGSEGSVSSYDGNEYQNPRKNRIGSIADPHLDSGNGNRFSRRNQVHHLHRSNRFSSRSTYGSNEFDLNLKRRSHTIAENPNLERIKLLEMVRELQNQLERTKVSTPPQAPFSGRRMAFSGETTAVNRRLDGTSCHRCRPQGQDRHFSAQLPRQHVCCNGPYFEPNSYYSPRFSALSSPIHNPFHTPESEFSATDDYIHRNNDVTDPFRSPKNLKKKRYVRPVASGSPWVTCYRCSTLLELPQSLFVFNKKYHSLRCGACMKVLNFTLSDGMHVSRHYPEETIAAPPSSEVEDFDELNRSRVEPVSCSDRSFQKSSSTETDINGSWEFSERRKASMSRDPSGSTQPSSSKASGRSRLNGSPLHRLMGYASPSKVIRG